MDLCSFIIAFSEKKIHLRLYFHSANYTIIKEKNQIIVTRIMY